MTERLIELEIPKLINKDWLNSFNRTYSTGEFLAKMVLQEWLQQPEDMLGDTRDYTLEEKQNTLPPRNWKQSVIGKVIKGEFTHTPKVGGDKEGYGLFLSPSFLESKNSRDLIASGRLIFVRFDSIIDKKLVLFKDNIADENMVETSEKLTNKMQQVA